MKDLSKVKKGITHAGKFHTDDVLSTVLLKELNPEIEIIRVKQYEADDSIEDILAYDIGFGEFDHHQEGNGKDSQGNPLSAFGKLWDAYGRECLKRRGFKNIELAFSLFRVRVVYKVNQGDNRGYRNVANFYENGQIVSFNPNWQEKKEDPSIRDEQFNKAVGFASFLFDNWLRKIYEEVELGEIEQSIWDEAIAAKNEGVVVLKEAIPWQPLLRKRWIKEPLVIITKSERGGYSLTSSNDRDCKIADDGHLSFLHPCRFMGVAPTLEEAIEAAKYSLKTSKSA